MIKADLLFRSSAFMQIMRSRQVIEPNGFQMSQLRSWFIDKSALGQHLVDSHQMVPGFPLTGVAEHTKIAHAPPEQSVAPEE
jgi:hypothetical protein